jgi:hypothetical protein
VRHRAASADVARRGAIGALLVGALLCAVPVAAHELGDFGRVKPGIVNDELIPGADNIGRRLLNMPVSDFNITDQEREMHDRVYRFLIARHVEDWAFDYEQVVFVASIFSARKGHDDLYYKWLTHERYASSRVRYNTIADDVGADLLTLPSTFASICAVIEVDKQRAIAGDELPDIELAMLKQVRIRKAENDLYVARFVRAIRYRYDSYSYALDHFLVETPHPEAVRVDERLNEMVIWVDYAEAGDFCIDDFDGWDDDNAIPGRVLMDAPSEGEYRK